MSKRRVNRDDYEWLKHSHLEGGKPHKLSKSRRSCLYLSRPAFSALKETLDPAYKKAASELIRTRQRCFQHENGDLVWGLVIRPPGRKGRYFLFACVSPEGGVDESVFSFNYYRGDVAVIYLAGLLREGWMVIRSPGVFPGERFDRDLEMPSAEVPAFVESDVSHFSSTLAEDCFGCLVVIGILSYVIYAIAAAGLLPFVLAMTAIALLLLNSG